MEANMANVREVATLGGGCFWCLEAIFSELTGVEKVESGYAGGTVPNPTYQQVCSERTGHAEVVQVTFDPSVLSFADLLRIFFTIHDPTTLNRQGADVGTSYRSIILYHNEEQRSQAEEVIREVTAARIWNAPIVTQLEPLKTFYPAEQYHQEYFKSNPNQAYCQIVIAPKVRKFREHYLKRLKVTVPP
jgi:peptide-methionine (S)-S-oxide reductase